MKNEIDRVTTGLLPMELPSSGARRGQRRIREVKPCGRARADWWFDQMRRVVEEGRDFPVRGVW
jgi:hypothetical protein